MIDQLRQRLQALEKPAGLDGAPGCLPLGIASIDEALSGGLARGALHEIAAASEAHLAAASGFALGLSCLSWPGNRARPKAGHDGNHILWVAEDMALSESGAPCGLGLDAFLAPERLLTVAVAIVLWELLRGRAVPALQWISLALVLVSTAATWLTHDARFVMGKPSVIYLLIGAVFTIDLI